MHPAITGVSKAKASRKDYVSAFGDAVQRFTADHGEALLPSVPEMLVQYFEATRSELWLWDPSSNSGYLTHSAGLTAERRREGRCRVVERGATLRRLDLKRRSLRDLFMHITTQRSSAA